MSGSLDRRLRCIEQQRPAPGCPTCRAWPAVLTAWEGGPAADPHPATCPDCDRQRRVYVLEPAHSFDYAAFGHGFQETAAAEPNFADRWLQEGLHDHP